MPTPGTALWIVGLALVAGGLIWVLRYRMIVGTLLMGVGLALGVVGSTYVD
ncbi:hypothetical protein [Kribbella deserti]|uniref:LPXTG cell wall anchor domain-containing protein n=1 Tax=Kribbella deserti TaxID=1926257 RepID=A0ABV6QHI3_9ACTN